MKLHDMYIIRRAGGDCLVHQRFGSLRRDSSLVTAFFRAVEGFSQEVLGSGGTLKRIDRGDVQFLFEGGEDVVLALVCDKEEPVLRKKMNKLIEKFELRFHSHVTEFKGDISPFQEFRADILAEFPLTDINTRWIPHVQKGRDPEEEGGLKTLPAAIKRQMRDVLMMSNGRRSVRAIATELKVPLDQVVGLFSLWAKYGWIYFIPDIREETVLTLIVDDLKHVRRNFGEKGVEVVKMCDGVTPLIDISRVTNVQFSVLKTIVTQFIQSGILQVQENQNEAK